MTSMLEALYPKLIKTALIDVVATILCTVQKQGAELGTGGNALYITFNTKHQSVNIPDQFKEQYPDTMSIVLQHRYEDLQVGEDGFGVTLQFDGIPTRVFIPWGSLAQYTDETANFGIDFGEFAEGKFLPCSGDKVEPEEPSLNDIAHEVILEEMIDKFPEETKTLLKKLKAWECGSRVVKPSTQGANVIPFPKQFKE